ncbi:MAG: hypothetical protein RLZZ347_43 [Candidatus Parcubacteria bacterium]|jgi:hypothetical protein
MALEQPEALPVDTAHSKEKGLPSLHFDKREIKPNVVAYDFEHASVGINTTGVNYRDLPEIVFGFLDKEKGKYSVQQPEVRSIATNMDYIVQCIKVVAEESGIKEFWFYPYGEDGTDESRRESARLRLFKLYIDFVPAPTGHGYILRI